MISNILNSSATVGSHITSKRKDNNNRLLKQGSLNSGLLHTVDFQISFPGFPRPKMYILIVKIKKLLATVFSMCFKMSTTEYLVRSLQFFYQCQTYSNRLKIIK